MTPCPCCSGKLYAECCGRFIDGGELPQHPEQLMRSRYTAYTQAKIEYIVVTQCEQAAENFDADAAKRWAQNSSWLGLNVLDRSENGDEGEVTFMAEYEYQSHKDRMIEKSRFKRIDGRWFYVSGDLA